MKWCYKYPTLPVVRKCCFCVPVRKGIIIFGYINLVFALLAVPGLVFVITEEIISPEERSLTEMLHVALTLAFLLAGIIMCIVLLIGAHKRNTCMLKGYLYFSLLLHTISLAQNLAYFEFEDYIDHIMYFIFLSLNLYLLLLVYSTIRVIEESSVHYSHQNLR